MRPCVCCSNIYRGGPPLYRAAVARWVHVSGEAESLCLDCLNTWLDNADDDPDLEPAGWFWLTGAAA